jgi:hypothetical protein
MTIESEAQAIIKRIDYQEIIDEIKAMCEKNYHKGYGWTIIVECYDDADILELICEDHANPTRAQAIKTIKSWVRTWNEQYNSAQDY